MKEADVTMGDGRTIDLVLDISTGCKFHCTGCQVRREVDVSKVDQDLDDLALFLEEIKGNGGRLHDLILGPTDVMVARNGVEMLRSEKLKRLASYFENVQLISTFTDESNISFHDLGVLLDDLAVNGGVRLNTPFDTRKVDNPRYVERMKRNLAAVEGGLTRGKITKVFIGVPYVYGQKYAKDTNDLTSEIMMKIRDYEIHPKVNIDILTPHPRNGLRDIINNENLLISIERMTEILDEIAEDEVDRQPKSMTVHELNPEEGRLLAFTYAEGRLYKNVFLQESLAIFESCFEIPKPWAYDPVKSVLVTMNLNQTFPTEFNAVCMECEHNEACRRRDVISIKNVAGVAQCISPLSFTRQKPYATMAEGKE